MVFYLIYVPLRAGHFFAIKLLNKAAVYLSVTNLQTLKNVL
jgi:hypothetical protein